MTDGPSSCLYFGDVVHRRFRPRRHRLRYGVFSVYVDLDRIASEAAGTRLFGYNRRAVLSLHDADHGDGGTPLADWVRAQLSQNGLGHAGARIGLYCYPRLFGYVFNPLSVYFCFEDSGRLGAVLYEVSNTFGETHCYLFATDGATDDGFVRHECAKEFYVSPFIAMQATYGFRLRPPGDELRLTIRECDAEGVLLYAAATGSRRPFADRWLAAALLRFPLMTLKVIAGIHWEALRLWIKGVPLVKKPAPPEATLTFIGRTID